MGFIASELGTIPTTGFDWYVLFLEDGYDDAFRRELTDNFANFAGDVGKRVLAVRGLNPDAFNKALDSVYGSLAKFYPRDC